MRQRPFIASIAACVAGVVGLGGLPASASGSVPASAREVGHSAALSLRVRLDERNYPVGSEVRPDVELVNRSGRPLELRYMKPWAVIPEIWDEHGKTRRPNAPAFVLDQIVVPETVRLAPNGSLKLWAVPIFLDTRPRGTVWNEDPPGVVRAYWYYPGSGRYRLRYRIDLKDCLPGATGTLTSNDVTITLTSDISRLARRMDDPVKGSGILGFEAGRGYFLTVDPTRNPYGAPRIWLKVSENKVLVRQLDELKGRHVSAEGQLPVHRHRFLRWRDLPGQPREVASARGGPIGHRDRPFHETVNLESLGSSPTALDVLALWLDAA